MDFSEQQPIVIVGMHRSGTSMLSRILEEAGVFWGVKKDQNNESRFFIKQNEQILKGFNASWDRPDNIEFFDDYTNAEILSFLKEQLSSFRSIEYWGIINFIRGYNKNKKPQFWGWKDPRNTLTIDYWRKLFPHMKIIHIYRHPLDVAYSLRDRQVKFQKSNSFKRKLKRKLKGRLNLGSSQRGMDILEGVKLWDLYTTKAFEIKENIIHIKYEELLNKPLANLRLIFDFVNLSFEDRQFDKAINKSRAYAYKNKHMSKQVQAFLSNNATFLRADYSF